jgi:hypothetical protein
MKFSAIGTCLLGIGTGRANSQRIRFGIISKIRRLTTAGTKPV